MRITMTDDGGKTLTVYEVPGLDWISLDGLFESKGLAACELCNAWEKASELTQSDTGEKLMLCKHCSGNQ